VPSIINGLFSGRSGIQSHGAAIAVLADNIANSNTTGYKTSRADFADLLAGNLSGGGGNTAVGSGSDVRQITQIFTQGTFEFTGRGLDLAVDGNGFFIVQDPSTNTRFYTRAGNFSVDADGNLLNQNGLLVQGFPIGGTGGLESLNINTLTNESAETSNVNITGNLDASVSDFAAAPLPGVGVPTYQDLADDSVFSTFVDVFDSLGAKHTVSLYFFKPGAAGTWDVAAYVDGSEVTEAGATAGVPYQIGRSTLADGDGLQFDSSGALNIATSEFDALGVTWSNGAADSDLNFSFNPFTQFASPSTVSSITQDGAGAGSVIAFNVATDGTLVALLDNGQTSDIGQIGLANFANQEGLRRVGGSLFLNSPDSGEPVVGTPNVGQFGAIESGALELSTADIASDFIKLISLQRGFQGSSRIITNIDDLLSEIVNLA